jgi:hypothetical protein
MKLKLVTEYIDDVTVPHKQREVWQQKKQKSLMHKLFS